ncbi:MAG: hypothetical protein AAF682_20560 [Planctomycetota bacterium]
MIGILLLLAAAPQAASPRDAILAAAGVELVPHPPLETPRVRFRPPLGEPISGVMGPLRDGSHAVFATLPAADCYLDNPRPAVATEGPEWVAAYPAALARPERLVLRQSGRSPVAEGALAVGAARGARAITLREARTGCAMEHPFNLPLALGRDPATLPFRWNLRSALDPTGAYVLLYADDGVEVAVPIQLEPPAWGPAAPDALSLGEPEGTPLAVEGRGGFAVRAASVVRAPLCVALEPLDGLRWRVVETAAARLPHACAHVEIHAWGDEAEPYRLDVRLEHPPLAGAEGEALLSGELVAGERVLLGRLDGAWRVVHADRVTGAEDVFRAAGGRIVQELTVPPVGAGPPELDWLAADGEETALLRATVQPDWPKAAEAWRRAGR